MCYKLNIKQTLCTMQTPSRNRAFDFQAFITGELCVDNDDTPSVLVLARYQDCNANCHENRD